jgi:alpha-N-arabinofuranosidase
MPSICRAERDYYLVTSSFVWFPGIPVYHSKDLVNWELIGQGIMRPSQLKLDGVDDKDRIWAVTIRYLLLQLRSTGLNTERRTDVFSTVFIRG